MQGAHYDHLAYDADDDEWAWSSITLPEDFDPAADEIAVKLYWETAATTGNVLWQFRMAPVAAGENIDIHLLQQSIGDVAKGTTRYLGITNSETHSSVATAAAGEMMNIGIHRQGAHGSDTMLSDALFIGAGFQFHHLGASNAQWS